MQSGPNVDQPRAPTSDYRAVINATRLKPATDRLLSQITPVANERRSENRTPYCCSVTLRLDEEGGVLMPAYIRDISPSGMGFKHGSPLEIGDVTAIFQLPDATEVQLRVRICWTRRLDDHWFISGGQFVDVVDEERNYWPIALMLLSVIAALLAIWTIW